MTKSERQSYLPVMTYEAALEEVERTGKKVVFKLDPWSNVRVTVKPLKKRAAIRAAERTAP